MTESNTPSEAGPNTPKPKTVGAHYKGESMYIKLGPPKETPRERMIRVVQAVQKKQKGKRAN